MADMHGSSRGETAVKGLFAFSIGLYVLHLMLAVCFDRALYADGALFFVDNVSSLGFSFKDDEKHIRLLVNLINQAPLSIGLLLGVRDIGSLRVLFGAGLFFVPVLFYVWCFVLSVRARDYTIFLCSLISFVVFAIPSEMFVLNQAFTSLAVCWVLAHYAILSIRPGRFERVAIVLLGLLLFRAHESMLFWGVGLSFVSLAGMRRSGSFEVNPSNLHRYYIAAVGGLSSAFVVWWQFTHPVAQQTSEYLELLGLLSPAELWSGNTRISILVILGLIGVLTTRLLSDRYRLLQRLANITLGALCLYMVLFSVSAFRITDFANPFREYQYRFLMTFGSSVVLFLAPYARWGGGRVGYNVPAAALIFSGLLASTIWQLSNDFRWSAFREASIRSLAYANTIVVEPERVRSNLESVGQGYLYRYRWDWTWPVYGLSLHASPNVLRIYRPEGFGEYFVLPRSVGDEVRVPFTTLPQRALFDFSLLTHACVSGQCQ